MQTRTNAAHKLDTAQISEDQHALVPLILGLQYSSGELISKNIRIGKRRTSIRLEPEMWQALDLIVKKEKMIPARLFEHISQAKKKNAAFTAALRSWILSYFVRKAHLNS